MSEVLFALWIVLALALCPPVQTCFWVYVLMVFIDMRTGQPPTPRNRWTVRRLRRALWPAYVLWLSAMLFANHTGLAWERITMALAFGAVNYWTWRISKKIDDDDDWLKKLVEKGQGVVERVGNRLAVVAPAGGAA